jgi:DNA mismatch endonuclease (patch repair protein)
MPKRTDRFSKAKRSEIMSRIRSKNTKLDLVMKKMLQKADINFRMYPRMIGNPDFLVEDRIALFCDGSFWHGRNWEKLKAQLTKGSNPSYWVAHISRNRRRDRQVSTRLRRLGYNVLRFWDYEVFTEPERCSRTIKTAIGLKLRDL